MLILLNLFTVTYWTIKLRLFNYVWVMSCSCWAKTTLFDGCPVMNHKVGLSFLNRKAHFSPVFSWNEQKNIGVCFEIRIFICKRVNDENQNPWLIKYVNYRQVIKFCNRLLRINFKHLWIVEEKVQWILNTSEDESESSIFMSFL